MSALFPKADIRPRACVRPQWANSDIERPPCGNPSDYFFRQPFCILP